MYIGLIPDNPVFEGEHLTLCWLGHEPTQLVMRVATDIAEVVSVWLQEKPSLWWLYDWDALEGRTDDTVRVGLVSGTFMGRLRAFRTCCENLGLNQSEYLWNPHITSQFKGEDYPDEVGWAYAERNLLEPFKFSRCLVLR